MEPSSDPLAALTDEVRAFTVARGWTQFHNPKNLAMALVGEAGELAAEFQWLTPEESEPGGMPAGKLAAVEAEMADVLIYLVQLADRLGTNLPEVAFAKMAVNAARFPVSDESG
ncbi:MAG: nucleotide pyrophosphohydrolase [Actinomycetota bacterium]